LTDRSKSQRKRRLQLNAEEFAPPPDLYEASAEPRLDETWVQYYGGEKDGGLKRLLPEDEEAAAGQTQESDADGGYSDSPGADHIKPEEAPRAGSAAPPEVQEPESLSLAPPERPPRPIVSSLEDFRRHEPAKGAVAQAPAPPDTPEAAPDPVRRRRTTAGEAKRAAAAAVPPSPTPQAEAAAPPSFEEWSRRWSPWLKRGGSIKVCEAFFELTHARGSDECFTSNSAIMELTGLSRAQCIRNIHYLIEMGFLDELSEVNNREAKGTYYRFNLVPRSLATA
jgi:hypothetical protein